MSGKIRKKSGKSQRILRWKISGNPVLFLDQFDRTPYNWLCRQVMIPHKNCHNQVVL